MLKRVLSFVAVVIGLFVLAACGSDECYDLNGIWRAQIPHEGVHETFVIIGNRIYETYHQQDGDEWVRSPHGWGGAFIIAGDTMEITWDDGGRVDVWPFSCTANTLSFRDGELFDLVDEHPPMQTSQN